MSTQQMRQLAAQLLRPNLILFPVRHHSPGCAWQLQRLLDEQRPATILVEGPRAFDSLIPMLTSSDARMPLAVYTYAVHRKSASETDDGRCAAYYPFCDHSPELVALRAAQAQQIPARFIDLNFDEQSVIEAATERDDQVSLLDERHYQRSRYLQALATQLGCRNHEELWEHLFEVPATTRSLPEYVADVATYCHLARQECSEEELTKDGTLQREAEMAWHIRDALERRSENEGPVLAVIGGFHAVALPELLAKSPARPSISTAAISDTSTALIRYGFDRLDRLNGYSAGMTSPAWQQLLWEQINKYHRVGQAGSTKVRSEAALTVLFQIAAELRERHGVAIPMPSLRAAYEHCLRLATLRQRPAPVRDDVLDAVRSCFVKGDVDADGAVALAVAHRCLRGEAMGKVPAGASTPPLVKDFMYRARRQRLKIDDSQPRRAVLDIYRRAEHRITSRLLHGLSLLGVPFGICTAGPDFVRGIGLQRLQEHWEYSFSALTESALVEASVYGVTLPLAVANRFAVRVNEWESATTERNARTAAALLAQACVLGLHDHLPRVVEALRVSIAGDAHFASLTSAVGTVALLSESREPLEANDVHELPELLKAAYERAIFLGHELPAGATEETEVVQALTRLRETLVSQAGTSFIVESGRGPFDTSGNRRDYCQTGFIVESGRGPFDTSGNRRDYCQTGLDGELYWTMITALHGTHASPLIRGTAAGLLYCSGRLDESALTTTLSGYFGGGVPPADAVRYLGGLLTTAREVAWQLPVLLQSVDELLQQWDDDAFVGMLPGLRLAFAEMTPRETDRIAESVARLHGADDLGRLVRYDMSAEQVEANLELSRTLLDLTRADGLDQWLQT